DVVDQCGGPGTDAENVVDVHGDAVDAHAVVAARGLCDEKLRSDTVRGDGDAERLAHRNHVGEVANVEHRARARSQVEGWTDPAQECAKTTADRPYADHLLGQRWHRSDPCRRVVSGSAGRRRRRLVDSSGAPTARAPEYRRTGRNRKGGQLTFAHTRIGSGYRYPATRCA